MVALHSSESRIRGVEGAFGLLSGGWRGFVRKGGERGKGDGGESFEEGGYEDLYVSVVD